MFYSRVCDFSPKISPNKDLSCSKTVNVYKIKAKPELQLYKSRTKPDVHKEEKLSYVTLKQVGIHSGLNNQHHIKSYPGLA